MNQEISIQLQRLMNAVLEQNGLGGAIHEIDGHKVRCYSTWVGNTNKKSLRFDLDGKRCAFAKVMRTLDA